MSEKANASRKSYLRRPVLLVFGVVFVAFLILLNRVEKPVFVTTAGRTFEKARVEEILKDNIQENGRRYGEQEVLLLMLSGPKKGQTVEATSSAPSRRQALATPHAMDLSLATPRISPFLP